MRRAALLLTYGMVTTILFSIAVSQILLGAALVVLVLSDERWRFPPIKTALALFFAWTLLSAMHSGHFVQGLPQIRKFFVFSAALVICTSLRRVEQVTKLIWLWVAIAMASSVAAFFQLWIRYQQARAEGAHYYEYFLDARLHGLASHWMTFGGELMIASLMFLGVALWDTRTRVRMVALVCLPVLWASLVLGLTRGVFLVGVPVGAAYLLLSWRRWTALAIPALLLITVLLLPFQVGERFTSVFHPHGNDDSNARRIILTRTGLNMIRAHPVLGLGPEQVGRQFLSYVPRDIPRPLPKGWYGHLHNIYLQYAAERGIPAVMLVLWILGRIVVDLSREARLRGGSVDAGILHGAVAATLGVMGEGLFEHNLGDSEVLTMFLAAISCGYIVKWAASTVRPEAHPIVLPWRASHSLPHAG